MPFKNWWKLLIISLLVVVALLFTWYFHSVLEMGGVFTHFFYVPITLASYWWGRRGILVAVTLGALLVASDLLLAHSRFLFDDLIRSAAFLGIGSVVAFLRESGIRAEVALKQANKELAKENEARRKAEEAVTGANRKLNLLSKITRHDILNRLMITDGYLQLQKEKSVDAESVRNLERMESALKSIRRDMEFTRDYEEIGAHGPDWQSVAGLFEQAALKLGMGDIKTVVKAIGVEVFADRMLVKVFYNLLDDSMGHGGNVTEVRLWTEMGGDNMIIVYEDDGTGIPQEEKERIFDLGVVSKGGSGLFLAREILSITGISIKENGIPGKGVRFEMTVPLGAHRTV